jgi:hypothetical protein
MDLSESEWMAHPPTADQPNPTKKASISMPAEDDFELQEVREHEAHEQVIPGVSPGALLDAMEDPNVFSEVARGDLYVQMARLRRISSSFSPTLQMDYVKWLSKVGKVDTPAKDMENPLRNIPLIQIDMGNGQSLSIGSPEKDVTPEES